MKPKIIFFPSPVSCSRGTPARWRKDAIALHGSAWPQTPYSELSK